MKKLIKDVGLASGALVLLAGCATTAPGPTFTNDAPRYHSTETRVVTHPGGLGTRRVMTPSLTGTGATDYYNLFARLEGTSPAAYGISFASQTRFSHLEAQVTSSVPEPVHVITREEARMHGNTVRIIEAEFDFAFMLKAYEGGSDFQIITPEKTFSFHVPEWVFLKVAGDTIDNDVDGRRRRYVESTPGLSPEFQRLILDGRITEGMTLDDVRAAWGGPTTTDRVRSSVLNLDTWLYGTQFGLTFKDGILDQIRRF